jgi:hypothetical protein
MASKQGGKGKQSSQSDKNYWARIKARGGVSARKEKNIKRAGKGSPDFPRIHTSRPVERVVFSSPVARVAYDGEPVHWLIVEGQTIATETSAGRIAAAISALAPRLAYRHVSVSPITGRQVLVSSRSSN